MKRNLSPTEAALLRAIARAHQSATDPKEKAIIEDRMIALADRLEAAGVAVYLKGGRP